ncbi:MAG: SycD/LcrH family type III secretion system chaperone [Parachlamydia sp.]|nr:SycD/LcrH family type III secretion system chaperone [Parachlamydia sp.]
MKGEQHQVKKAVEEIGASVGREKAQELQNVAAKVVQQGMMPKDMMGLSDAMVEGIYGQAFRLYNTGKYRDASQLFRLLIMLNSTEPKYAMGLAACFHMLKEYKNAVSTYAICGVIDPENPVPHYHASDCYIHLGDTASALIALDMAIKRAGEKPEYQTLRDRAKLMVESLKKENLEKENLEKKE